MKLISLYLLIMLVVKIQGDSDIVMLQTQNDQICILEKVTERDQKGCKFKFESHTYKTCVTEINIQNFKLNYQYQILSLIPHAENSIDNKYIYAYFSIIDPVHVYLSRLTNECAPIKLGITYIIKTQSLMNMDIKDTDRVKSMITKQEEIKMKNAAKPIDEDQ